MVVGGGNREGIKMYSWGISLGSCISCQNGEQRLASDLH